MNELAMIIILYTVVVFLLALIAVILVRNKEQRLKKEMDFLDVLGENRRMMLKKNAVPLSVRQYASLILIASVLSGSLGYILTHKWIMSVLTGSSGAFLPDAVISVIARYRDRKFNRNYAKALEQMASSLSAGLSIALSVKDVVECSFIDETLRRRFAEISSRIEMGSSVQDAFSDFAVQTGSKYAEDVALSIDIQNMVGGHEAEVIRDIAEGIHERIMLDREIKSIFTETVLTVRVIQLIAPLTMAGMVVLLPSYKETYLSGGIYTAILILLILFEIAGVIIDTGMIGHAGGKKK